MYNCRRAATKLVPDSLCHAHTPSVWRGDVANQHKLRDRCPSRSKEATYFPQRAEYDQGLQYGMETCDIEVNEPNSHPGGQWSQNIHGGVMSIVFFSPGVRRMRPFCGHQTPDFEYHTTHQRFSTCSARCSALAHDESTRNTCLCAYTRSVRNTQSFCENVKSAGWTYCTHEQGTTDQRSTARLDAALF